MVHMLLIYMFIVTQILVESFPVSSSGHIWLLQEIYMKCAQGHISMDHLESFMHVLHIPTLVIIVLYFFKRWFFMLTHMRRCFTLIIASAARLLCATVITVIVYSALKPYAYAIPVPIGFIITILVLASIPYASRHASSLTMGMACVVGMTQGFAVVPGLSRLGLTYATLVWLGLHYNKAFEIAWTLQVPLICGAIVKELVHAHTFEELFSTVTMFHLLILGITSVVSWYGFKIAARLMEAGIVKPFIWYLALIVSLSVGVMIYC